MRSFANPFAEEPGNRVVAIFLDERTALGRDGIGKECNGRTAGARQARNLCPLSERTGQLEAQVGCSSAGTARNMNTVAKLAELAREMS